MKTLLLLRHAKSDWHSAAASDFERPLNGRGKQAASLIGQRLAERAGRPERIISSPAKRARQTAKRIAVEIGFAKGAIEHNETIYEASLETLIDLVRSLDDRDDSVMLVGHNPGFSELGQWLTPEAPEWLPTCGLLELELPIETWRQLEAGCADLRLYDYPKKAV